MGVVVIPKNSVLISILYFRAILSYDDSIIEWTTSEILMEKLKITKEKADEMIILFTHPFEKRDFLKDPIATAEKMLNDVRVTSRAADLAKLKALYKYPVILDCECACRTIDKTQKMPKETEEFLGMRLPTKCYLYLLLGLINPRFMSILSSGKIAEYSFCCKTPEILQLSTINKSVMYKYLLYNLRNSSLMKPYLEKMIKLQYRVGMKAPILEVSVTDLVKPGSIFANYEYSNLLGHSSCQNTGRN